MEDKNKDKLEARCRKFWWTTTEISEGSHNQKPEFTNTAWVPRGDKKGYKIQERKKDRYHKEEETINTKEQ